MPCRRTWWMRYRSKRLSRRKHTSSRRPQSHWRKSFPAGRCSCALQGHRLSPYCRCCGTSPWTPYGWNSRPHAPGRCQCRHTRDISPWCGWSPRGTSPAPRLCCPAGRGRCCLRHRLPRSKASWYGATCWCKWAYLKLPRRSRKSPRWPAP